MIAATQKFERVIGWIVLALLLGGCLIVLRPFFSALLWAVVLCFSCWPIYLRVLRLTGNRRTLASLVMSLGMVLIVFLPFVVIGVKLADNVKEVTGATQRWLDEGPPAPPAWLEKIPLVGASASKSWRAIASDSASLMQAAKKLVEPAGAWLLALGGVVLSGLVEFLLSILIAFFLFRDGVSAAASLTAAITRIGGERGAHLLTLAGKTIRGVVYGILGTAIAQALLAGIGFLVAGIPGPGLLALLTFFLSVVPMGPPIIWIPAALWLFHQGQTGWGIFMIIWGIVVSSIDNVIKPLLISQGANMPFLLILMGVLGGAIAFGFVGVFLGPTLLAVVYRIVMEWIPTGEPEQLSPDMGALD
jgi:predicted PurR-regulated permease PerM